MLGFWLTISIFRPRADSRYGENLGIVREQRGFLRVFGSFHLEKLGIRLKLLC